MNKLFEIQASATKLSRHKAAQMIVFHYISIVKSKDVVGRATIAVGIILKMPWQDARALVKEMYTGS